MQSTQSKHEMAFENTIYKTSFSNTVLMFEMIETLNSKVLSIIGIRINIHTIKESGKICI